ncbi:235 kDa-family protein [Francisella orientalis str. Toba 04]|nr:235 kDa-family protein [Francisella orientalis str. Toba 04]
MDNTVDKEFRNLFENISIYYDQERSFRINKIDECIDNIIKVQDKTSYTKFDLYNLKYLIEDIKYSTNLILSDTSKRLCKQILKVTDNILDCTDTKLFISHFNDLKKLLNDYKSVINKDILYRTELTKTKKINELESILFNILEADDLESYSDMLIQLYTRTINNRQSENLIERYKEYFYSLKNFIKNYQGINCLLPFKENPLLSLLNLAYVIKNGIYKTDTLLASDLILLRAFYSTIQDTTKLNIINDKTNINLITSLASIKEEQPSENLEKIIDFIDLQIFSISRYFDDFDLDDIFFYKTIKKTPKPESFEQLVLNLKNIPNIIFDEESLYKMINQESELYKKLFVNDNHNNPIEKIIEESPANLLTRIFNKYFQALLEIATSINLALFDKDFELIYPFVEFEKHLKIIAMEIANKSNFNRQKIEKSIKEVHKTYHLLKSNYSLLEAREQKIIKEKNGIEKLSLFIDKKTF